MWFKDAKLILVGIFEAKAFAELASNDDDDKFVNNARAWLDDNLVKSFDETTELNGKPFTTNKNKQVFKLNLIMFKSPEVNSHILYKREIKFQNNLVFLI